MRSLYLRIWVTVVAALALFAVVSGWLLQRHLDHELRLRADRALGERVAAWGELLQRALPPPETPAEDQARALDEWSARLGVPLALDDEDGRRVGVSQSFRRRAAEAETTGAHRFAIPLEDGRTLIVMRPTLPRRPTGLHGVPPGPLPPWWAPGGWPDGVGLAALLVVLFIAVAAGAWPVVRRLTRRLEALKRGVEAFGAGALGERVSEDGRDEVAALGASFNRAAARIEALLQTHRSLLANASHELRSPLARLKMALSLLDDAPAERRVALRREVDTNIAELDSLVEEVLLASRLETGNPIDPDQTVELLAVAAEEGARVNAVVEGSDLRVPGNERLLRRALRNLLENARRYGGEPIEVHVAAPPTSGPGAREVEISVCDRGPGIPEAFRERIFEPFFRLPGHAEREGGVGLGLALVRQIVERHGGTVRCLARAGGGSRFTLRLPAR